MKLENYLNESFVTYKHKLSHIYGIYEKPTKSELISLIKEEDLMPFNIKKGKEWVKHFMFRFIADIKTKKIFVFNYHFLHEWAMDYLEKEKLIKDTSYSNITRGIINYNLKDGIFETYNFSIGEWGFLGDYIDKLNNNKVIKEEFSTMAYSGNDTKTHSIYKNPSKSEILSIIKNEMDRNNDTYSFRLLLADNSIFVFSGSLFHRTAFDMLQKEGKIKKSFDYVVTGQMEYNKKNKIFVYNNKWYDNNEKFDKLIKKLNEGVLKEDFSTMSFSQISKKTHSIYKNPSKSEILSIIKDEMDKDEKEYNFRLLLIKGDIFVFNSNLFHAYAFEKLQKENKIDKSLDFFIHAEEGEMSYSKEEKTFTYNNKWYKENKSFSNFINKLNKGVIKEAFSDYVKNFNGNTTAVYVNPTKDEIKSLMKEEKNIDDDKYYFFRFIAIEETKEIFVFSSFNLHSKVSNQLVNDKKIKPGVTMHFGVLKLRKKLNIFEVHDEEGYKKPSSGFEFVDDFVKKLNKDVIKEEFANYVKSRSNETVEIFKNPSLKELLGETKKDYFIDEGDWISFRIIINLENKNIYIAASNLLHNDIYSAMMEKDKTLTKENSFAGFANLDLVTKKFEITHLEKHKVRSVTHLINTPKYKFIQNYVDKINGRTLKEEFCDYVPTSKGAKAVYKNPTKSEIKTLVKEEDIFNDDKYYYFRFIAMKETKDIFLFSGDLLHDVAVSHLFKNGKIKGEPLKYRGVLKLRKKLDIFEGHFESGYLKPKEGYGFVDDFINKLNK